MVRWSADEAHGQVHLNRRNGLTFSIKASAEDVQGDRNIPDGEVFPAGEGSVNG